MRWIGRMSEALHDFRQEPGPAFGLINPDLDQTGRRHVVVFLANFMSRAEIARQCLIVGVEFCQHLFRGNAIVVIVLQALVPRDIADRVQRGSADFARTFGNIIAHVKDLFRLFVEQHVIVPEVLPGHMPVEILGLQVERECIGQQST